MPGIKDASQKNNRHEKTGEHGGNLGGFDDGPHKESHSSRSKRREKKDQNKERQSLRGKVDRNGVAHKDQ